MKENDEIRKNPWRKLQENIESKFGVSVGEVADCLPYVNDFYGIANLLIKASDSYKFNKAIDALCSGKDIEKSIDVLYKYINSKERAFYIVTCFRKILLSNSPIACAVIGYIMGEKSSKNNDFCNHDIILLNALENMSDFDIRNFKEIMEGFEEGDYKKYWEDHFEEEKFPEEMREEYEELMEFCEKYRLFYLGTSSKNIIDEEYNSYFGKQYYPKQVAYVLWDYKKKVDPNCRG